MDTDNERLNQAERNLLAYLRTCVGTPTDTELVRAVQALPDDEERRETAISSLRWACDPADYDLMMAAGDLGGAELDVWDMTL